MANHSCCIRLWEKPTARPSQPSSIGSRNDERRSCLKGELGVQSKDAWIHVRRRRKPPGRARCERLVERKRDIVVRQVVDVEADGQPISTHSNDLLQRQIEL